MRVLVCGGRYYANRLEVFRQLDGLHGDHGIDVVIHGGCSGADALANRWASLTEVPVMMFEPDWSLGRKAGPLRNQQMIDEGKPDIVLAFPGGRGTADMKARARNAGVLVCNPCKTFEEKK